jgi:hypothetical protein
LSIDDHSLGSRSHLRRASLQIRQLRGDGGRIVRLESVLEHDAAGRGLKIDVVRG